MSDSEDGFTEELLIEAMRVPQAIVLSNLAFGNPMRPQYCAQFLHGVWLRMFTSEDTGALPAAFHFVVVRRTEAQMKSLFDHMSRCNCSVPVISDGRLNSGWIGGLHEDGGEALVHIRAHEKFYFSPAPTHFLALMDMISVRLPQTLNKINPIKLAKLKGPREWPASLNDIILPTVGPETTVESLEQWVRYMSLSHLWPIELLGMIGYICRSRILPAIVQSPTVIPTILRTAGQICDDAESHLSPRTPRARIVGVTGQLTWRLRFIAAFFRNIFWNGSGSPEMLDEFPLKRKSAIVQVSCRVIEMLRLPLVVQHSSEDDRIRLSKDFKANLALFLDVGVSTEGLDPDLLNEAICNIDRIYGPPLTVIRNLLLAWKQSLRCYAMTCGESLQTSHAFQRCGNCKVISYCGKECQRRAWRDHKPICKTITKIIRDGGGNLNSVAFAKSCETGKVDAGDAEQIITAFGAWRRTHGRINL